mgnify:CR=1 FL=1
MVKKTLKHNSCKFNYNLSLYYLVGVDTAAHQTVPPSKAPLPPPPPPPPPPPGNAGIPSPPAGGADRAGLLNEITGFKGGLKKVQTDDRSGPSVGTVKPSSGSASNEASARASSASQSGANERPSPAPIVGGGDLASQILAKKLKSNTGSDGPANKTKKTEERPSTATPPPPPPRETQSANSSTG